MNAMPSKRAFLFALALTTGLSTAATAQINYDTMTPERWAAVGQQIAVSLESPYQGVRVQNIKNAIFFATFYRDRIDLSQAVKTMITICDDEKRASEHLVTLAALQAIGGVEAQQYLASRIAGEQADEVRRTMLAVLDDYYASRSVL